MILYFAGAEIPGWRKLLADNHVSNVSLSYMGLRRRTKFKRPFLLSEKFPDEQSIFLDSGAYTINRETSLSYGEDELVSIAAHYMSLVHQNIDRIGMVSEFDALPLGYDWISAMREDFWDDLPEDKFLPIWHPEFGLEELDKLARRYPRIGVPQTALGGRNLVPLLNGYVQTMGTKLHGIAMTKPDEMAAVRWDSVASTSWISPSKFGDTIVWTGNQLKRYPKNMKEQARKRHRTLFTQHGFDAVKIEADDTTEVLRLSIWSWKQLAESLERHRPMNSVVATFTDMDEPQNTEIQQPVVDNLPEKVGNNLPTLQVREEAEMQPIPVLGFHTKTERYEDSEGNSQTREIRIPYIRSDSMRRCDTCFLASKCPAFRPGYNCAYNIPLEVRTKDQVRGLFDSLIEMQTQRIMFMRMAEDLEGGYADPNLSGEIDRLERLIARKHEMEQEGWSLKVEAKGNGPGIMSKFFGAQAGEQARALPAPAPVDDNIIDVLPIDDMPDV